MPDKTSLSAQRRWLLHILTKITNSSTTLSEQKNLIQALHTVKLHTLEECLLQVCHVCVTCTVPVVKDMLRAFMLSLAAQSFYVALRLSWNIDSVLNADSLASLNGRMLDIQDCIESYAINQVTCQRQTLRELCKETNTCTDAVLRQVDASDGGEVNPSSSDTRNCPVQHRSNPCGTDDWGVAFDARGERGAPLSQAKWAVATASSRSAVSRSSTHGEVMMSPGAAVSPVSVSTPSCGLTSDMSVDVEHALRKERRLKMFNDERQFIAMLTETSNALSCCSDREFRMRELTRRLTDMNKLLPGMSVMHPLGGSADPVMWIVRIAVEEAVVFSSRLRAPYLVRYEVIVDRTATMRDPAQTSLRLPDGRFRRSAGSDEVFELQDLPLNHAGVPNNTTTTVSTGDGYDRWCSHSPDAMYVEGEVQSVTRATQTRTADQTVSSRVRHPSHARADSDGGVQSLGVHHTGHTHHTHAEQGDKEGNESIYLQTIFSASTRARMEAMRRRSPWAAHPSWDTRGLIVKAGDDLRQEELALQLIHTFSSVWKEAQLTCWVRPYSVVATGMNCGVMGVVEDSMSIDAIKKAAGVSSLYQFFVKVFDGERSCAYRRAQQNFIETMAGYSIISYILQVKDRHNGNLMISRTGELTHIDFGYFISTSPGGIGFESAPFKLSQDHIDIMGGTQSDGFNYYCLLLYQGLLALGDYVDDIAALLSLIASFTSIPCLGSDPVMSIMQLRGRFQHELPAGADYALYVRDLITNSADNWRSRRYDQFQTLQNGIL